MSRELYAAAYAWVGHWRGGLASATIVACAGFAAVSGSSVASAVTMGRVCLPEMERYKYDPRPRHRHGRRRRHARHSDSAEHRVRDLRHPHRAIDRPAAACRHSCRASCSTALFIVTITIWTQLRPELGPPGPARHASGAHPDPVRAPARWWRSSPSRSAASISAYSRRRRRRRSALSCRSRYALYRRSLGGGTLADHSARHREDDLVRVPDPDRRVRVRAVPRA